MGIHPARGAPGRAPRIKFLPCYECLNKIIPLGEKHLRLVIREYTEHYHAERNRQGLDSRIIIADDSVGGSEGDIKNRSGLNFLFHSAMFGDSRMPQETERRLSQSIQVLLRFLIRHDFVLP